MSSLFPTIKFKKGRNLHSIYIREYGPSSFNPNTGIAQSSLTSGGRFHPFLDHSGHPIATKYAADHPNGAFAETLMCDDKVNQEVSIHEIESHGIVCFRLNKTLEMVNLDDPVLENSNINQYLMEGRRAYLKLRTLAATIYEEMPSVDGIVWRGKQLGVSGMLCYVLFEPRCSSEHIEIIEDEAVAEGGGLRKLLAAAIDRKFQLPEKYIFSMS